MRLRYEPASEPLHIYVTEMTQNMLRQQKDQVRTTTSQYVLLAEYVLHCYILLLQDGSLQHVFKSV